MGNPKTLVVALMSFGYYPGCSVSWCNNARHGNSQYCSNHARRNRDYGHPQGKPITKQELAPYLKRVKAFFKKHKSHPATVEACAILERWFKESAQVALYQPGDRISQELKRLYDGCVSGREALETIGAVWLFAYERPHQLPDDKRTTFALSRALLQLRPQAIRRVSRRGGMERMIYAKPGANVHEIIGQQVRDSIGVIYVGMIQAMKRSEQQAQDAKARLRTPFDSEAV